MIRTGGRDGLRAIAVAALILLSGGGCGRKTGVAGTGGVTGAGGAIGTGGAVGTGGVGSGGAIGSGGVVGTGGSVGTGGVVGTGGSVGSGGLAGTGGAPGAGGATTTADGAGACTGDGWCWVFPLPHGNYLRGVWGSSASDVWAVGDGGTLMHWDGAHWATTLSATRQRWYGVWGSAANDVWVVGTNGAVQHFDGSVWQAVAIGTTAQLTSVWGTGTGAVFVGVAAGGGVWRSDGGGAFVQTLSNRYATAVQGSGPNDVWAVGDSSTVHWDGAKWTDVAVNTDLVPYPKLNGLYVAAPNDAWATAENGSEPLFHYDGTGSGWRVVKTPGSIQVYGIHGISNGEIWAFGVGGAYRRAPGSSTWVTDTSLPYGVQLTSLWGDGPDDVWAVGLGGLVLRRAAAGTWTAVAGSLTVGGPTYGALSGTAPDDVWATGNNRIGHFDGSAWTERAGMLPGAQPIPNPGAVLALARDDVWVLSLNGKDTLLYHFDGSVWTLAATVASYNAAAIWGGARDDIWLVSSSGLKVHYDGKSWSAYNQPPYPDLERIAGAGAGDVWAVGPSFATSHWDGKAWTSVPAGADGGSDWLTTLCVSPAGEAWTAGSNQQMWRWAPGATAWRRVGASFTQWPSACTALSDGTLWVAATSVAPAGTAQGDLARWDGALFRVESSGLGSGATAIWSTGASATTADVWAVGPDGVVHRAPAVR